MAGSWMAAAAISAMMAFGQPVDLGREGTVQERQQYRRLVREVKQIEREYEQTLQRALDEARGSPDGEVSLEWQAELTNLRDERDRKQQRLELLALRHGWPLPGDEVAGGDGSAGGGGATVLSDKEQVFASAAEDIRQRAALEAAEIARAVPLPTTPVVIPR